MYRSYNISIKKISIYGVYGLELDWFRPYLRNRNQIGKSNQTVSKQCAITCAVPHAGLKFGALSFLISSNDLPKCLDSASASMFADDTNLTNQDSSLDKVKKKWNVHVH